MNSNLSNRLRQFYPRLLAGDLGGLLSLFADEPRLDDPRLGRVEGRPAFERYLTDSLKWLEARSASVEPLATTATPKRVVEECVLNLQQEEEGISLPVALAGDISGERFSFIRVYHSMWPLLKKHSLRPPVLDGCRDQEAPDVVGRYQEALGKGDLEAILAQFEPDGYAREPSGEQYVYRGKEALRELYGALFSNAGSTDTNGIPLEHCAITDDGVRCAIEYNVTRLGQTAVPPQAGIAVYERGESGLLAAARIYDDVDVPTG